MDHDAKTLLVLGGSTDQLFMLRTAREMGLRTACLDGRPDVPGFAEADLHAPIDFSDLPAVFAWIEEQRTAGEDLAGVCTMGSDVPHLLARICLRFGWTGPTVETGRLTTDKLAMKECLNQQGIAVPRFCAVESEADARAAWSGWQCARIVIKPTDRAGSRGVGLLDSPQQIAPALQHARTEGKSGRMICEEYVPGPQISTETVVWRGRAVTCGFADRLYDGMEVFHPQIMENGGWLPSYLAGTDLQDRIEELVARSAGALGIIDGVGKGDVVVCPERGPLLIEMAARLSGGDFSEGLVPLGTGINYVRAAITIALGNEPSWELLEPTARMVVANRYFFPPPGLLEELEIPDDFAGRQEVAKLQFVCQPGWILPRIRSHGDRAGVMVVVARSRSEVQALIDEGYRRIRFKIDGRWCSGDPSRL